MASALQELAEIVEAGKLSVVICPQPSLVSEKHAGGTRMRMWGAVAHSKVCTLALLHIKQAMQLVY